MTAALTTSTGEPLDVESLPAVPGLGGLYARGAAAAGRIAAGRALPAIPGLGSSTPADDAPLALPRTAYRVAGVQTAGLRTHLRDYQRLLHEPGADALPSGYLHVLAFPLATAVMVRGDFPLPLLGMVHLANDASLLRPVTVGEPLEVRAWSENLRAHRRGVTVDLVAEVHTDGELAWHGVSTYLAKGFEAPSTAEAPADPAPRGDWVPPLPTGRWALPGGTGRAYAAISGDRNPIHLSSLSAKAFGFPRAIAHGMYTAARALAEVGPQRGSAYRWTVDFSRPVLLPSTVDVAITADDHGFAYVGWNSGRQSRHFAGTVAPLHSR